METIKKGSKCAAVKILQSALHLAQDGIFGSITEEAVLDFQRNNGLKDDGIVGEKTWEAIHSNKMNFEFVYKKSSNKKKQKDKMKNICLELVPIKSSSCRSFMFDSSVNCTPTSLCKNRSFKYGRKLFNSISVSIHHFYRIATCFSSRFSGSFNKSIILIVVCVCTPFNIRFAFVNSTILVYIHKVISFIFIFMINARKFLRICEKSFGYKAMNMIVSVYRVFCKRNPTISVSANSSFKDTSVKIPFKSLFPTNCLTFGNVWKPSNSPKIAYLIQSFVPFNVFPYFFHDNKKCSKCSEDGTSIVLLTRSNKSSNVGISYIPVVYVCKDNIKILYSPTK